jgi:hypothetical protein
MNLRTRPEGTSGPTALSRMLQKPFLSCEGSNRHRTSRGSAPQPQEKGT